MDEIMTIHILLVEDEAICAMVEKGLFESLGCEVTIALSGEEALQLIADSVIKKRPYNAIAMDIGLPDKSGVETCAEIRKYEAEAGKSAIPIIAVTSNTDEDMKEKCLSVGMSGLMPKQHNCPLM
jgi:CheY-like chemotaxis protein